ncbi:hypothetical protein KC945_00675 [Candidatus Saccharibacteria bacterium]|jgi:ADP-ribose pyrophosphatase|nr:hypothetical protein [Candidatus Saccharibacteria bacterium]
MSEKIVARGKIFELVQTEQSDGRLFEMARRAPGVRVIIADFLNKKVLLTREYRNELSAYDYRLPGGKVFDTLDEFAEFRRAKGDIKQAAHQKAIAESREEAAIAVDEIDYITTSKLGATVEWDLYIFEAKSWKVLDSQSLEIGEDITHEWYSFVEVEQKIMQGSMQEERVAMILLRWLKSSGGL